MPPLRARARYFATVTVSGLLVVAPAALRNSTVYVCLPIGLPATSSFADWAFGVAGASAPEPTSTPFSKNRYEVALVPHHRLAVTV